MKLNFEIKLHKLHCSLIGHDLKQLLHFALLTVHYSGYRFLQAKHAKQKLNITKVMILKSTYFNIKIIVLAHQC